MVSTHKIFLWGAGAHYVEIFLRFIVRAFSGDCDKNTFELHHALFKALVKSEKPKNLGA